MLSETGCKAPVYLDFSGIGGTVRVELGQLNVKTIFLCGDLEEIYMSQPTRLKTEGKEHVVCKLKKSLYGLKQSPRQWYKRFHNFVRGNMYTRSDYDSCVYYNKLPS